MDVPCAVLRRRHHADGAAIVRTPRRAHAAGLAPAAPAAALAASGAVVGLRPLVLVAQLLGALARQRHVRGAAALSLPHY